MKNLEISNFKFQMKNWKTPDAVFFIFHLQFEILNFGPKIKRADCSALSFDRRDVKIIDRAVSPSS